MKTTSKRVISLLLAIMMVLSIFTIVPLTASAETVDNALLESQNGEGLDDLTYSANQFNEVGTTDSSLVFRKENITITDNSGRNITDDEGVNKDTVFGLTQGTFIIRFKSTTSANSIQSLISVSNKSVHAQHFHIYITPNGVIGMESRTSNSNNQNFKTSDKAFDTTVTNTIAVKYDGSVYYIFLNGAQIGKYTRNSFISGIAGLDTITIGGTARNSTINYSFQGNIDFIECYSTALTDAELVTKTKTPITDLDGKSSGTSSTLTWTDTTWSDDTSPASYTIKADGEVVTPKSITCTESVVTAVVPVSTAKNIVYTVENSTHSGTVTVTYVTPEVKVTAPTEFTAKALYKSHKIEWNTKDYENAVFELYRDDVKLDVTITTFVDGETKYYSAVVTDEKTVKGTAAGTVYTLKGNINVTDNQYPTAIVEQETGFAALRKNALLVIDYENDADTTSKYKTFNGGAGEKITITALQAYKLSRLTAGAIFALADYDSQLVASDKDNAKGKQAIISFSSDTSMPSWMGVRNAKFGGQINDWLKGNNTTIVYPGGHLTAAYYNGSDDTKNWGYSVDGLVEGGKVTDKNSFMRWNESTDNTGITVDSVYVGATNAGADPFYGDVYYVIVSEEKYTSDEISAITGDTPYNKLSSLLATTKAKYISTGGNYKNDEAYRKLENALTTYSAYTAAIEIATIEAAIEDINDLASKVTERTTELAVEAINKTILSKNADDNSHANSGNDGSAVNMFDDSTTTLWHSCYSNEHGLAPYGTTYNVNATHPVWMQTGFDKTEYVAKIECKPRTDTGGGAYLKHQIKNYEVYVSNNETKPFANVSVSETDDWTLVKSGTLDAITSSNANESQVITFTQPVEARWIRLVVTSTSSGEYLCIAGMEIYKATDTTTATIGTQIADKIAEAKALLNSATVVNDEAYATYTTALATINAKDLATEATQDDLKTLNDAIAALSFTTTNAEGTQVTYTGAAQQTIDSIDEKIEEAKHIIMQAGVVDTAELEAQITALEALTVTTSVNELTSKLEALQTQINTAKTNEKTVNKADTLASDSVKWNNTATRLETLKNNVKTNVANNDRPVKNIFDGNYSLNAVADSFYGSWRETVSERKAPWISINLGESVCVSGLVIFDRLAAAGGTTSQNYFKNFEVWVSNDENFSNYVIATSGTRTDSTYSTSGYEVKFDQPYDCQYIKFVTYGDVDCKIVEMDIYEYVGAKEAKAIKVTESTATSIKVGAELGEINFSKKFTDGFSKAELEKQLLDDIKISDIAYNYVISVDATTLELSVAASDTQYKLTINNKGTVITDAQTKKYGENFDYAVENAKGWKIDDKVVCDGNTFNYKATDNMTATAIFDKSEVVQSVSAYIPTPIISNNGTKYTVQIPVYINGTTNYEDKGIVFVKSGTTEEVIKKAILGTEESSYVKIFSAGDNDALTLTNKGRYLHTLKISGKLPAGDFYAYVVTADVEGTQTVTLSNVQSR